MAIESTTSEETRTTFEETAKSLVQVASTAGAVITSPLFLPGIERVTRPVLKTVIGAYFTAADAIGSSASWLGAASTRAGSSVGAVRERWGEIVEETKRERTAVAKNRAKQRKQREAQRAARRTADESEDDAPDDDPGNLNRLADTDDGDDESPPTKTKSRPK